MHRVFNVDSYRKYDKTGGRKIYTKYEKITYTNSDVIGSFELLITKFM